MSETFHQPRHLVVVRHGEGEGDLRRAAFMRGEAYVQLNSVDEEPLTDRGIEQNHLGGLWIKENVLAAYGLNKFSGHFVSPTLRTMQSAAALDLPDAAWQADNRLTERDRGLIKGWRREKHQKVYPESYAQMHSDPIYWIPPGGESIANLSQQFKEFLSDCQDEMTSIIVGHRDRMWAGMMPLENLSPDQLASVDTNKIDNGQIWHYTNLHPETGNASPELKWKRSVCPWAKPEEVALAASTWIELV